MNKPVLYSLTLAALAGTVSPLSAQQAPESTDKRPNIILFMVDDMGWQDTSLPFWTEKTYYNSVYETPNMERLAKQGMMFTQAYACPLSSATRCTTYVIGLPTGHWKKTRRPIGAAKPCNCRTGTIMEFRKYRVQTILM